MSMRLRISTWMKKSIVFALVFCFCLHGVLGAKNHKENRKYRPKNGVISIKGEIFGGEFRVTNVIPLHGDFSKYYRLEITPLESVIGPGVPDQLIRKYTNEVYSEFKKSGRFKEVQIVKSFKRPLYDPSNLDGENEDFRESDSLEAPMLAWEDLIANDEERLLATQLEEEDSKIGTTLVVTGEVIDYAKGNKYLDLLPLDLGNAIISVRFSYYDKETGEELGRQVISSETGSKLVPMLLSVRNTIVGLVEGLVDQITRRKAAAER